MWKTQLWPSFFFFFLCTEHRHFWTSTYARRTQILFIVIFCAQNTMTHDRHLQCAEHRQFSPSCCVCRTQINRTQTILTVMLCLHNTGKQNTDNSNGHAVCTEHRQFSCHVVSTEHRQTEHRQFSPSCCIYRKQTVLTVMLSVQNTDKQNTDNYHCHVCAEHKENTDSSHPHVVCAEHWQTEHRQFSLSFWACRTQLGGGVDTSISGADDSVW